MERRKEINGRLVRWIAEKAEREYAEDISLVLIYGSYVNGTANSRSDVDCCFIPKTERGYEMATGFILEGVGYDIFPMSWERVERIACLRENLTPLVGDAEIIFCGSAEDMARLQGMQEKSQCCLADGAYVREIAEERCREAGRLCGMLERVRTETEAWKLTGMVIMTLADAVAVFQHGYFHFGLKQQFEDLMKLREVPEGDRGGVQERGEGIQRRRSGGLRQKDAGGCLQASGDRGAGTGGGGGCKSGRRRHRRNAACGTL